MTFVYAADNTPVMVPTASMRECWAYALSAHRPSKVS